MTSDHQMLWLDEMSAYLLRKTTTDPAMSATSIAPTEHFAQLQQRKYSDPT